MSLIIDWLFPKNCFGCQKGDNYLCNLCENTLKNGHLSNRSGFEGLISVYKYDGLIKEIIEKIKYEFISDPVKEMAELMNKKLKVNYPNITRYWQKEKFVLVPIPLFSQREKWRGYNQSELLTKHLARMLNLTVRMILCRNTGGKNQASIRNRQIRKINIKNVFKVGLKMEIPKNIVLVDDVITSGATMCEARRILSEFGVQKVWGLSLCGVQK
ncbi:MAG TPA: phosphoribosyltransferase family protein [Candidatus Methanoperedens sp.]|nr:phosphoribosyltransferase family protein [Candidatus Methanoperedens sp.]